MHDEFARRAPGVGGLGHEMIVVHGPKVFVRGVRDVRIVAGEGFQQRDDVGEGGVLGEGGVADGGPLSRWDVEEIRTVEAVDGERQGLPHDVGGGAGEAPHQVDGVVVQLVLVSCLPRFVERVEQAREENVESIEQFLNAGHYVPVSAFGNRRHGDVERHSSTCRRIGSKFRCIRSTPIARLSSSEKFFECFAKTAH